MFRGFVSTYAVPAIAAAALLALAPAAQAQRFHGGRSYGGMYYGGYYPGSYYGGYHSPGYYNGYVPGGYYQPYITSYGYQGNFHPYPSYSGYQYSQPLVTPGYGFVQPDITIVTPGTTQSLYTPSGSATRMTVRLPADAQLWVDNFQPQLTGPVRVLTTPPLQPGQTYYYTVKAQWNDNGRPVVQERVVRFSAGGDVNVDFTQPAPATPQSGVESGVTPAAPTTPAATPPLRPNAG